MHTDLMRFSEHLAHTTTLDACLAEVQVATQQLGFKTLIYDYAPVPVSHEGALITPSVFKTLDAPSDMHALWCERGYYQIDPVQQCAARRTTPFAWSFSTDAPWSGTLTDAHRPVAHYIRDYGLSTGLTVPLHLPDGGFATLTAIVDGTPADAERQAQHNLGEMLVLAHAFQARASELLAPAERCCSHIHLTRRERECLQHSAKGLTAKGIAATLHRSEATVNLHLIGAARKLGARNRVEAVVRGLHYRLVEV
ncbi:helix-turn-helix transcriptional regulator [Pseudomonas sp. TE24901]